MLGIQRLTARGADYYLSDLARELPVPVVARSEWVGQAARGLGLQGAVDPQQLQAILQGHHPTSGLPLRSARATVLGFDLTFSAPKSVSVLFALGGEEVARQVVAAHGEGVAGALAYAERHSLSSRRGSGEWRHVEPTTGLVAAAFTHGVSRNLDPHLHTHVVMANLVHGLDSRWSSCDQRGLSAHRVATGAVYDAHLRDALSRRLGVSWVATPGLSAELDGVSPMLVAEFSSRRADITRHMAAYGSHRGQGARVAWAATRPDKQVAPPFPELAAQWRQRARAVEGGAERDTLAPGPGRAGPAAPAAPGPSPLDEHRFGAVLSLAPDGAARRRDVVAAFGTAAVNGAPADGVERLTDLWVTPSGARTEVGVAEDVHPLRTIVPGPHLLQALGPRPVDPSGHAIWREAARSIEDYRCHWGVTKSAEPLGLPEASASLSALPVDRLVEHLRTSRHIETARQRLGQRPAAALELDRGR
jgi:conjugative relaxase-like TrwC/TraI family protein